MPIVKPVRETKAVPIEKRLVSAAVIKPVAARKQSDDPVAKIQKIFDAPKPVTRPMSGYGKIATPDVRDKPKVAQLRPEDLNSRNVVGQKA